VRWLIGNLPLMVMALILAILAWFVALEQADPTVERTFPEPVPVSGTEPGEDLMVVGSFQQRVQVTLRTTQSIWDSLEMQDFDARADLSGLGPGTHEVPVDVDLGKEPMKILRVEPETVIVDLGSRANRIVPVRVQTEGEPAVGYIHGSMTLQPRDATVEGPSRYVNRVVEAYASLSIDGADGDIEQTLTVRPRDSEGDSVPYVSLNPDTVAVRLPVEPSGYHSTLAVRAVLTGEVASGYRVTDISIDPPTVTVFGDPADLAALEEGFIETKPVNVDGAQDDVVVRPGLGVPATVTLVPGQEVEVRVSVEAIQSSLTVTSTPEVQGLEPGYTVTLSPDVVQVVLNGPLPKLESLGPDGVRVVLDLFELPTGTHQVEPQVIAPEDVTPQSVIPATIQVRIAVAPSATTVPGSGTTITPTMTVTSTRTTTGQ
jgi:YbbR domain-containing protein